jgi:hypothetical protein
MKRGQYLRDAQVAAGLIAAFREVYFLAKHRLANRLLKPLRKLAELEGNSVFKLAFGKSIVQYTSSTFQTEALAAMNEVRLLSLSVSSCRAGCSAGPARPSQSSVVLLSDD